MMGEALGARHRGRAEPARPERDHLHRGVAGSFDLIEPHVRKALRAHTFAPPLAEVPLLLSDLGEVAGIIGAAYLTTL
jgi:predicted NBD/HSP70 family sugar kinase